jgi:hypothetical protein
MVEVGDRLPPVVVERSDGSAVELGDFLDRLTVVVAIRYYG